MRTIVCTLALFVFINGPGSADAQPPAAQTPDATPPPPKIDQLQQVDPIATGLNPNNRQTIRRLALHNLTFSPDGKLLAIGSGSGRVFVYELPGFSLINTISAHTDWAFSIAFSPDGSRLYTAGGDNLIKIWDLAKQPKLAATLKEHTADVHALAISTSGDKLVSAGDDKSILVWNLTSRAVENKASGHQRQIPAVAVSKDDRFIVTGSRDTTVRLWTLDTAEPLRTFEGHVRDVMSVRFTSDSRYIASGSYDSSVRLWEIESGAEKKHFNRHQGAVVSVDVSPNDQWIASVDHSQLHLNPIGDGETRAIQLVTDGGEQLSFVRFHPDGNSLAVSTTSGRVLLVDATTLYVTKVLSPWNTPMPKP